MDVRDQEFSELLRQLMDEVRSLREGTTVLLREILAKLESIERSQYG